MTTVQQVFDLAVTLMDQQSSDGRTDWGDTQEYKNRVIPLVNLLQGELFPLSDTAGAAAAGVRAVCPPVVTMADALGLDDVLGRSVLPYGLAAMLLMEENPASAAYFQQRYEELRRQLGAQLPADWEPVADALGYLRPGGFGRW